MTGRKRKRCSNDNLKPDHHGNATIKSSVSPPKKRRTLKAVTRSAAVTAVITADEVTSVTHRNGGVGQKQDSPNPTENRRAVNGGNTPSRRSRRVASMKGSEGGVRSHIAPLNINGCVRTSPEGINYRTRRIKVSGRNEKVLSIDRRRSRACSLPLPPPLPPRQVRPTKVKKSTETPEIVSVISTACSPSEEEVEETTIRENPKSLLVKTKRSTLLVRFGFFGVYAIFFAVLIYILRCKHLQQMNKLSVNLNTKISHKKMKLDAMRSLHSRTLGELDVTTNQLETSILNEKQCNESNIVMEGKLDQLTHHFTVLSNELNKARERLSAIESEQDMKHSLSQAWEQIDSLVKDKHRLTEQSTTCEKTAKLLSDENDGIVSRIVELELALVDAESNTLSMKSTHEIEVQLRKNVEAELTQNQEKIDELEDQLDKKDGRAWYYQLQMQHLEGIIDDQEQMILDFKNWNQELLREKEMLKRSLDSQMNEAVSALNAVASSATLRKAEQFQALSKAAAIEKDAMVQEAAGAVQAVIAVVRKTKEVKPNGSVHGDK